MEHLKLHKNIVFSALSGSHAYGLNTPTSDKDYRGIYIADEREFFGLKLSEQVSDNKNDVTYYELNRFLELLSKQNPNIIELLWMPKDCIEVEHPVLDILFEYKDKLLSKEVRNTFGGYAISQIKKARGLNKKIVNPVDKVRKTPIDFCYVVNDMGQTMELKKALKINNLKQENCGLSALNHVRDGYALFYSIEDGMYRGIAFDDSNELRLSSIPKGAVMMAVLVYNKDGYTEHCKDYKEYWEWVENRNPHRYEKNIEVGKNYDTKNMMHCVRLLHMAEEILISGQVNVRRPDRDYLLSIRNGEHEYDKLIEYAESRITLLDDLMEASKLPDKVDHILMNKLAYKIRKTYYE